MRKRLRRAQALRRQGDRVPRRQVPPGRRLVRAARDPAHVPPAPPAHRAAPRLLPQVVELLHRHGVLRAGRGSATHVRRADARAWLKSSCSRFVDTILTVNLVGHRMQLAACSPQRASPDARAWLN